MLPQGLAEREIRAALVNHIRATLPDARIIHELDACGNRMDVAAVTEDHLFAFEIKSEKDKLDRLADQMRRFAACSHRAVAVLHERWFDRTPYHNGSPRFVAPQFAGWEDVDVWAYPQPEAGAYPTSNSYRWRDLIGDPRRRIGVPAPLPMLRLLHKYEALTEASKHGVKVSAKAYWHEIHEAMALDMTGRQIVRAVCRQLRARDFAHADPPIKYWQMERAA